VLTPELHDQLCLGAVAGGVKFCTLGAVSCNFVTHAKKVEVFADHLYVATGKNSAFTHHHVPVASLTLDQLEGLLQERHSKEEWTYLIRVVNVQGEAVMGAAAGRQVSVLDAVTPGRKRKERLDEVRDLVGALFTPSSKGKFRDDDSAGSDIVILPSEDSSDLAFEDRLANVVAQWDQVVLAVNKAGTGLAKLRANMASDLNEMEGRVLSIDARLGLIPNGVVFEDCVTVWDGLTLIHTMVKELGSSLDSHKGTVNRMVANVETQVAQEVSKERTTLEAATRINMGEIQQAIETVADFTKVLALEQEKLTEVMLANAGTLGVGPGELNTLKAQIKLLEARLPLLGTGRLGGEFFQSRVDVLAFVEDHIPSNGFYLFHDVVTLMESLMTSHVERRDVLQEWYQSTKVGVNEASARHMASFRLVLPTVFGRTKEGAPPVSVKHYLPAVKSFKDWNTFDGVSGTKGYITSGMEDLKYQFRQDIDQSFDPSAQGKARLLASEMHELSQNFVMEMCSWMDSFFQELVTTSEATEDEAWEVVSACIKKMFEVIRVPRAQAANATMDVNPKSQCATYLWALVQSHKIMKEFVEARFRNHGAIAPVIVLHIFKTRVTRVAMQSHIKRLEGRISALEKGPKEKK
jgi:hypothetical protein